MNLSQMTAAQNVNFDWVFEVEDAETLLLRAWDRFFSENRELNAWEAQEIGTLLRVCCDRISAAVLSYRLSVGEDGSDVEAFFRKAADYQEARELNRLNDAAFQHERKLHGSMREAFAARRLAAMDLPPAESINALRGLLKGGEHDD